MKEQKQRKFSSIFANHFANFIEMRRGMGYRSKNQIDILFNFDRYLKNRDYRGALTQGLALDFVASNPRLSKNWSARKYTAVQQFSVYLSAAVSDTLPLLRAQGELRRPKNKALNSIFADHITTFIALKKGMGYQFENQALILRQFDRHLHDIGYQGLLTQELALNFATSNPRLPKKWSALKYSVVQQFSVYLSAAVSDTLPLPSRKLNAQEALGRPTDKKPKSIFAGHISNFIALKKGMGYQFENQALILLQFDRHLHEMGYQGLLTQELALNFATSKPQMSKNLCVKKYQVIRQFADYLAVFMPDTPLLRPDVLMRTRGRPPAHIFTDEEMALLMNGARRVSRGNPLRNVTFHTIIGLAASTGLRVGEVAALDRDDVNLETGILTVRRSKFQKDRLVLVHPTTIKVLRDYVSMRDIRFPHPETPAFFVSMLHQRFAKDTISDLFHRLAVKVGVRRAAGSAPRFHDLRHTFAVRRLIAWYREGKDVQAMLPLLATYMGHVDFSKTAYYLTATAELLGVAAERYEAFLNKEAKQ